MIASLRMSRRRAATRLWPKRMPVDGFDENLEIVVPIACAAHFVRLSANAAR